MIKNTSRRSLRYSNQDLYYSFQRRQQAFKVLESREQMPGTLKVSDEPAILYVSFEIRILTVFLLINSYQANRFPPPPPFFFPFFYFPSSSSPSFPSTCPPFPSTPPPFPSTPPPSPGTAAEESQPSSDEYQLYFYDPKLRVSDDSKDASGLPRESKKKGEKKDGDSINYFSGLKPMDKIDRLEVCSTGTGLGCPGRYYFNFLSGASTFVLALNHLISFHSYLFHLLLSSPPPSRCSLPGLKRFTPTVTSATLFVWRSICPRRCWRILRTFSLLLPISPRYHPPPRAPS